MSQINLNSYKIFKEVAQSKSYSKASEKLYISVPAISTSITKLEKALDTQLFYRQKDGVRLTEAGNELFEFVNQGLASFDLAEKMIMQKNDLATGEIVVGCQSHLATYYLMNYIESAKKDYPNLRIKLISAVNSKEMMELLEEHKIDFIIDTMPPENNNVEIEELKIINNIFISKEPLEIHKLRELEKLKYILNFNSAMTTTELFKTLSKHKIKIEANIECDVTELRVEAVKRNLGIGYVMKEAVTKELSSKEVYEVKMPIELPKVTVNLIYLKEQLTKTDKKFIKQYLKK
ncbi:MAG: LysR family transcriptional regulator [Clostridia bacterium]|nr:LysR family transcriptional regulator [Clostridia bacterium]